MTLNRYMRTLAGHVATAIVIALAIPCTADAQPVERFPSAEESGVGIYAGYGFTSLSAAFAIGSNGAITDASECGQFESGTGSGFIVGAMLDLPLLEEMRLNIMPEYSERSGTLRFPCVDPAGTRRPDGSVVPAITDHVADITHHALGLRLTLSTQPFALPLHWSLGPVVSMSLPGSYRVHEEIVTPGNAEFLSGGQVREYGAGDIAEKPEFSFGLTGGVRYYARIGERLTLVPELSYQISLTDEVASIGLRTRALRGTLGVLYRFGPEPPPQVVESETPAKRPPMLALALDVDAVNSDGTLGDTLDVRVQRTLTTRVHPLLTYLFFDQGSAEIPRRYTRRGRAEIERFSEGQLFGAGVLETYYNILDIIGARLRKNPGATITVTGAQPDGEPRDAELKLARERATRVREYLTSTWGIAPERILIEARRDPATQTNPETPEGMAENRRVEITSDQYEITAPVLLSDTTLITLSPAVRIRPTITTDVGVERWSARVLNGDDVVASFDGDDARPAIIPDWKLDSIATRWTTPPAELDVMMTVWDRSGQKRTVRSALPLRHTSRDDIVQYGAGYYSLILFDFSSATLRPEHHRTIAIVNQRTDATDDARVLGYTDKLGEADFNIQLSQERARVVAAELRATVTDTVGVGESSLLYDNTLPEGRFYSRCVTIETR